MNIVLCIVFVVLFVYMLLVYMLLCVVCLSQVHVSVVFNSASMLIASWWDVKRWHYINTLHISLLLILFRICMPVSSVIYQSVVKFISSRAYKILGRSFSSRLPLSSYLSLVRSQLTYASQIWRLKDISALERILRRATKYNIHPKWKALKCKPCASAVAT